MSRRRVLIAKHREERGEVGMGFGRVFAGEAGASEDGFKLLSRLVELGLEVELASRIDALSRCVGGHRKGADEDESDPAVTDADHLRERYHAAEALLP